MSRDVGYHDAHVLAVEDDKVVKVAGHRGHREVARRDVEACLQDFVSIGIATLTGE